MHGYIYTKAVVVVVVVVRREMMVKVFLSFTRLEHTWNTNAVKNEEINKSFSRICDEEDQREQRERELV